MNRSKQQGMNILLLAYILVTLGLLTLCAFKIVPAYLENSYVTEGLKTLAENHPDDLQFITKSQIKSDLGKYYMLNNVRDETILNSLDVERLKEKTLISVSYEVRTNLGLNIDLVIKFDNVLDSSKPEECCAVSESEE